jgi:hypothetical protein
MRKINNVSERKKENNHKCSTSEEPTEEQKEWVKRKINDFYLHCYFCDICGKSHNPVDLRTYDDVEFFNTVQKLVDRLRERKILNKIEMTI